jgi:hypothetical protein
VVNGKEDSFSAKDGKEIMNGYLKFSLPQHTVLLIALLTVSPGLEAPARSAGPVLYQDCTLSWDANTEPDLAGYRVHLGRDSSLLNQARDAGMQNSIRCSEAGAIINGQWFGAITAYDLHGNESSPSEVLPFELDGLPDPEPARHVSEPVLARLSLGEPGFQLMWFDPNVPPVAHRIEVSSSLQPDWSMAALQRPGVTRFNYFQPQDVEWVCYRVRGESGAVVSEWAQADGSNDRQVCFEPTPAPTIEQPILDPSVLPEPRSVRVTPMQRGFEVTWEHPDVAPSSYRIEVIGSVPSRWTTLAVLPPGTAQFTLGGPIDAEWVCVRIRAERQPFVSLWGMTDGPFERFSCFKPEP